ncbi:MAG TPA: cutinase family protein [Mycobacterium sp.]|nr:cutinase family protein [Mycobacterium sp.]
MNARFVTRVLGAGVVVAGGLLGGVAAPPASAEPCPDVQVVFARETGAPPGVGGLGQAFVDALRSQVGAKSVDVYPVNYAASNNFGDRTALAESVVDGIRDAANHIESTANACPSTKMVLGGYSQGAALAGYVTSAAVPKEVSAAFESGVPTPMPASVADHVAAVVLFGTPSNAWLSAYGAPPITIGPRYESKTLKLCNPGDTICDGTAGGGPSLEHTLYAANGAVNQGANFAASHL